MEYLMSKSDLLSTTAPLFIVIDGDVGGIGKSTIATHVCTSFKLVHAPIDIFELDEQGKLGRFLKGDNVRHLHGAKFDVNTDGERDLVPIFAPLYSAMVEMPESQRSVIMEVGGALTPLWNAFVCEADMEEDIAAYGLTMVVFLLMVASEESARQVLAQIRELRRILPSAKLVIVLNERDGCPIAATNEFPRELRIELNAALETCVAIRMPRLRLKSCRIYEQLGCTPDEIVSWHHDHYREAVERTGKSLLEAKRFVKDIASWSGDIRTELVRIMPFLKGADA